MILRIYTYIFLLLAALPFVQCFDDNINKNIDDDRSLAKEDNNPIPPVYGNLPVPGNDGLIVIASISYDSAKLTWAKGSDDNTSPDQLMYKVVISDYNNITTADEMDLNGATVLDLSTDIDNFQISGLTGNSTYYANVMVRDIDGNKKPYVPVSFTTPAAPPYTGDLPVPGNNGLIVIASITYDSAKLTWAKGSDDNTSPDQLMYKVVISDNNNITTAEEMELYGTTVMDWSADVDNCGISGLTGNSTYYANVMVSDIDGNKKPYIPVSFTAPAAPPYTGNVPVPGNSGLIVISAISHNSAGISWTKGSDDNTPAVELLYKAVISTINNITTAEEMEKNGTTVMVWKADVGAYAISGLAGNTTYYANVLLMDNDGNIKAYNPVTFITPGIIYLLTAGPHMGGGMISQTTNSARADIDKIAKDFHASPANPYPALTCTNIRAFIGLSSTDSIKDFPAKYGVPVNWPIQGAGGFIIGYNWADLFDGSINTTLSNAKIISKIAVVTSSWWSGANADGSFAADSCSSPSGVPWSYVTNTLTGQTGSLISLDQAWLTNTADFCSNSYDLYYLCW